MIPLQELAGFKKVYLVVKQQRELKLNYQTIQRRDY